MSVFPDLSTDPFLDGPRPPCYSEAMKRWQTVLYRLWQWTWGLPQSLLGLILTLRYRRCPRKRVGGALATLHDGNWGGVSLGMFIFVPDGLRPEREAQLLSHEYGHTFQSALLGPLYLPLVGVPSFLWANLPRNVKKRAIRHIPYESRYPENWAEMLGHRHFPRTQPLVPTITLSQEAHNDHPFESQGIDDGQLGGGAGPGEGNPEGEEHRV